MGKHYDRSLDLLFFESFLLLRLFSTYKMIILLDEIIFPQAKSIAQFHRENGNFLVFVRKFFMKTF